MLTPTLSSQATLISCRANILVIIQFFTQRQNHVCFMHRIEDIIKLINKVQSNYLRRNNC